MPGSFGSFNSFRSIAEQLLRLAAAHSVVLFAAVFLPFIHADTVPSPGPATTDVNAEPAESFYDDALSFDDRVRYQRAIEEVYWRHRIWPAENPEPKPSLDSVLPDEAIRERVATYLEKSAALEILWSRPLTGDQLQAELNRMVRDTKNPGLLRELFDILDHDPLLVAECLARPVLVDRLTRNWYARDARYHGAIRARAEAALRTQPASAPEMLDLGGSYFEIDWHLVEDGRQATDLFADRADPPVMELTDEEWRGRIRQLAVSLGIERKTEAADPTSTNLIDEIPVGRLSRLVEHGDRFVVTSMLGKAPERLRIATVTWHKRPFGSWWTEEGRLMVAAAGRFDPIAPPSGGYDLTAPRDDGCIVDTWTELWYSAAPRMEHTAVWTGTEMIVWGGRGVEGSVNSGGRYDPATDSWAPTSIGVGAPAPRLAHTAVWTGTEMIVWGGFQDDPQGSSYGNSGGRYDPLTDSWTSTSTANGVPEGRTRHTAVWTGAEMIIWGGCITTVNSTT